MHKVLSIKKWFSQFGVEVPDWSAQIPDLNPIQQLWDELEDRPHCQTPVSDSTNAPEERRLF